MVWIVLVLVDKWPRFPQRVLSEFLAGMRAFLQQHRSEEEKMLTQQTILDALRPVIDPEIGMSVVDMGMIRQIVLGAEGEVEVKMVLTAPRCPLAGLITEQVRRAVAAAPGVKEAKVTLLDERWDPSWMRR